MKTCSKCKKELPATPQYFNRDKTHSSGFKSQCRLCRGPSLKEYTIPQVPVEKVVKIKKPVEPEPKPKVYSTEQQLRMKAQISAYQALAEEYPREYGKLLTMFQQRFGVPLERKWVSATG